MTLSPGYLRPVLGEYPPYYESYFARMPSGDVFELLKSQPAMLRGLVGGLNEEQQLFRYAEGKWSLKEVVGHVTDTERIFSYRALRILRGDTTPMPGYDQDAFVERANFDARPLATLLDEFEALRRSNLSLLQGHAPEAYVREGTASGQRITVRAIVNVLAAHVEHHATVIRERYFG